MSKHDAKEAFSQANRSGMKSINFHERIMPNTMLIDVKLSTMKIGNTTQMMSDIPVAYTITENIEECKVFLGMLKGMSQDDIHKVVLDNGDGFKIKSLIEFTDDIEKYITNFVAAAEEPIIASEAIIDQV